MNYTEVANIEKRVLELNEGDVYLTNGRKFIFVRVKRGGKSMIGTDIDTGKNYSMKIHMGFDSKKIVVGFVKPEKKVIKEKITNKKAIGIKDVKLNESVVIMTGRENKVPQLYTLVELKSGNGYSHIFKNPVDGKKIQFKGKDPWEVYRLADIIN